MEMLLDESGQPLDDVVVLDSKDIDIPPQSEAIIAGIRSWLNPTQYAEDGSEYQKHLSSHLKGTGQWAIESPIFQEWRDSHDQGILWIRGIPGAGKSVHAANLIRHLSQDGCPVLYFFFRHTIEANHRPEAALRDWLAQALPFSPPLQLELKDRMDESIDILTISELKQLVRVALAGISQAYCVVDALDEMDQATLEPFLHMLDDLGHWRPAEVKFIITSRPVAIVERIVRNIRLLDVRLDKELVEPDITVYLWHRLGQSYLLPDSHAAVVEYILGKADGLFLYAKLAMDAISHLEDDMEVQQALHSLPTDLTDMYSNLLQEHMQRTKIAPELQILILQCVTHAVRPLRLLELSDCITVTQAQHGNDPGKLKALVRSACGPLLEVLPDETVRVVHHSLTEYLLGIIRPAKDTTTPFVIFEPGPTHGRMAMLCLQYLHLGGLAQLKVRSSFHDYKSIEQEIYTPFTNYALTNWHAHIKKSAAFDHDMRSIDDYLHQIFVEGDRTNVEKLSLVAQVGDKHEHRSSGRPPRPQASALRLAIALDLLSFVNSLLERYGTKITNYDPDLDYCPLILAVKLGQYDTVQSLIRHGADVGEYDTHGATPLHTAVGWGYGSKGNAEMAETLLKAGADPEKDRGEDHHVDDMTVGGREQYPASKVAFRSGNKNMAAVFMPYVKGATQASRALAWAISGDDVGRADVVNVILSHPELDVNATPGNSRSYNMTPLYKACMARDSGVIRQLLAAGADPNIRHDGASDNRLAETADVGCNVLHALANRGGPYSSSTRTEVSEEESKECFRLVIAAGANVHQTDSRGFTPLHEARDKVSARCLIAAGADVNAKNRDGETPVHLLSDVDILEALTDVFDINIKSSRSEQTLLIRALDQSKRFSLGTHCGTKEQEYSKALKLIDLGADVSLVDKDGMSALHFAAQMEERDLSNLKTIWRKLADAGADPNLQDKNGETPLHKLGKRSWGTKYAKDSLEAFLDIVQPDIEVKDNQGRTPLFKVIDTWDNAGTEEMLAVLDLFVKANARLDVRDLRERTLLHGAASHCRGDTAHMKLLVDQGLDPNSRDADGNTIWHEGIPKFCGWRVSPNVYRGFTALGVDLSKTNNQGRSPLHVLSEYTQWVEEDGNWEKQDDPSLLEYILGDQTVDVNAEDNQGVTPLHISSTFSSFLVHRFLRAGADAAKATAEGLNAFHLAARSRQSNIIGILISWMQSQNDADSFFEAVNHKDITGLTPLYYACASGRYESVQLLVDADASIDPDVYIGSAWNGCADFEEEQRSADWRRWDDQNDYHLPKTPAGGVLISDKLRPKRITPRRGQNAERLRFPVERIDEIVDLLVARGPDSANKFLDEAITCSLEHQFDYTTMCLLRARKAMAITPPLNLDSLSECVKRREAKMEPTKAHWGREDVYHNIFNHLIYNKEFDAVGKLLLEDPDQVLLNSPNTFGSHGSNLIDLVKSGFASLIDTALTPEIVAKLRIAPKPQQQHTARSPFQSQRNDKEKEDNEPVKAEEADVQSDEKLVKLLETACLTKRPNMEVLRVLVEKKRISVNSSTKDASYYQSTGRNTVLHALAKHTRLEWWQLHQALPFLLEQGADTEIRNGAGMTPLQLCLEKVGKPSFSKEMAKLLLAAGADPNAADIRDRSCLALAMNDREVCEMLLSHGAKVSHSALAAAIGAKDLDLLQLMLSCGGVDPNMRKVGRETPGSTSENGRYFSPPTYDPNDASELYPIDYLLCSVSRNDKSDVSARMFDLLLAHGANLGARYERTTVVHRLVGNKGESMNTGYCDENAFLLPVLKHPSLDIETRDAEGSTVLLHACRTGNMTAINALLDRGADICAKDNKDHNALHLFLSNISYSTLFGQYRNANAATLGKDIIGRLTSYAPQLLTEVDSDGRTPLHCSLGRTDSNSSDVEALLDAGADVSAANTKTQDTPLHLLLGGAFHINIDEHGSGVVTGKHKDLLQRFISLGADINARNLAGETPAFYFFRQGRVDVTLPSSVTDKAIKAMSMNDRSQLYEEENTRKRAAAVTHEPRLWDFFDQSGMDWSATSKSQKTLLHIVAANVEGQYRKPVGRAPARFRFLMDKGIDVLAEDEKHQTALDVAAALGVEDVLEMFKKKD